MKRILCVFLSAVMLLAMLSGCVQASNSEPAQQQNDSQGKENNDQKKDDAKPAEQVTLKFFNWYDGGALEYLNKLQEKVKSKYPNITLEYEMTTWDNMHKTLETKIASGQIPDLIDFKGQDVPKYAKAGQLIDLTNEAFMGDIPSAAYDKLKVDGKNYALPYTCVYQGVFYNKKIFADNNLQVPKTYAELQAIVKTLKAKGITPFATHFKDNWNIGNMTMQFAMSEVFNKNPNWGADLYSGKVTFETSPEYKSVFEHMKDIYDNTFKDTYKYDLDKSDELFAKGNVAMNVSGTWSLGNFAKHNPAFEVGVFPFPGQEAGAKLIFEPDHTWVASSASKHKDEILKVLEIVATDKELAKFCIEKTNTHSLLKDVLPTVKSTALDDINAYKGNNEIVDVSLGNVQIKWAYQEEYSKYITEWLLGKKTLDAILKDATAYKAKVPLQ